MENKITKYQKFVPTTIKRSEINNAPYNPRTITDYARKQLKANIKKRGLLDALVVNKTTMNLVSGHQRLSILDDLEKSQDYLLTVAMIELSIEEEKSQNIFFNNASVMGDFDAELLKSIGDIDWNDTGFTEIDLAFFDIEAVLSNETENKASAEIIDDIDSVMQLRREQAEKCKQQKKEYRETAKNIDNADFYIILIAKDTNAKNEFLDKYGINYNVDNSYIPLDTFERVINKHFKG